MALLESNLWRSVVIIPSIVGVMYLLSRDNLQMALVASVIMAGFVAFVLYKQRELRGYVDASGSDRAEVDGVVEEIDMRDGSPLQDLYKDKEKPRIIYWELEEYHHTLRFSLWVKRAAGITGGDIGVDESGLSTTVKVPSIGIGKEYSFFDKSPVGSFAQRSKSETNFGDLYVDVPSDGSFRTLEIGSEEEPPEAIAQLLESTSNISSESIDPLSSNILGASNVRGDRRFRFMSIPVDSNMYVSGYSGESDEFGSNVIRVDVDGQSILTPQSKEEFVSSIEDKIDVCSIMVISFVLASILLGVLVVV